MRIRNILFATAIIAFLMGPTLVLVASKLNISLPVNLSAESAQYLTGGKGENKIKASLNLDAIVNGKFQKNATVKLEIISLKKQMRY